MSNPAIAYMSLSNDPMNARRAVVDALNQTYQNSGNTIYLIHQTRQREFYCDRGINVIHLYREGKWPRLFAEKIDEFLKRVKEPLTAVWDIDDLRHHKYIEQCLTALGGLDAVTNWRNEQVDGLGFNYTKHRECWGNFFLKTEVLREAFYSVIARNPSMTDPGNGWVLDTELRKYIIGHYRVGLHDGIRYFFQGKGTSTAGRRKGVVLIGD